MWHITWHTIPNCLCAEPQKNIPANKGKIQLSRKIGRRCTAIIIRLIFVNWTLFCLQKLHNVGSVVEKCLTLMRGFTLHQKSTEHASHWRNQTICIITSCALLVLIFFSSIKLCNCLRMSLRIAIKNHFANCEPAYFSRSERTKLQSNLIVYMQSSTLALIFLKSKKNQIWNDSKTNKNILTNTCCRCTSLYFSRRKKVSSRS